MFERWLIRLLNRRYAKTRTLPRGFYLGESELLVGHRRDRLLLPAQPTQHSIAFGRSGSGKTTLLLRLIEEHLRLGIPLFFLDFHGEATELLLSIGNRSSVHPWVLFEPWADPVIGWNPLETDGCAYGPVQELLAILRRRVFADSWGYRLQEILSMSLLALAEAKLTLIEAVPLLTDPQFRRRVLQQVRLPEVRDYWMLRFERLSPAQRSVALEPVLNKLSLFLDPMLKYVVGQAKGALDFDSALKEGQTVIANLSSGRMRGNNYLLAALLVSKFKNAVYRRPPGARLYAVFLDEFQELVALEALDDFLRSFRKFRCSCYLATQQLCAAAEMKAAIFANCTNFFCFATSASDAAFLGKEFGSCDGAIASELLPDLPVGQAIVKTRGTPAYLLRVTAPAARVTAQKIGTVRKQCQTLGTQRKDLDREFAARRAGPSNTSSSTKPISKNEPIADESRGCANLPEGYGDF